MPSVSALKGRFQATDRRGAVAQHLPGPAHPLSLELRQGHHLVDQAHGQGLLGAVLPAEEPDLAGLALAHHPGQVAGAEAAIEAADPGAGLAEHGVIGRQAEVAEQVQHLAAADGVARHQGDHHLGQAADQPLQVEHVQPGQALFVDVAAVAPHALVTTGAKGMHPIGGRPGAGEQHHPDGGVVAHPREGIKQLAHRAGPEGIALLGPVDGDAGDALLTEIKQDV
jgi:hypothetical protein